VGEAVSSFKTFVISNRQHRVTFQKAVICIFTVVTSPNLAQYVKSFLLLYYSVSFSFVLINIRIGKYSIYKNISYYPVVFYFVHFCLLTCRDHCSQCCHKDESGHTVKRYAQARLEVCTCKFGTYPQIQGMYWYLYSFNLCSVEKYNVIWKNIYISSSAS
jgi:hypothetical protein